MRRRTRLAALFTAACVTAAVAVAVTGLDPASAESNGGVRVMPLGDSITDGFTVAGGYRIELWNQLVAGGHLVDFVGSQSNGPASLGDHDHEGLVGWRIDQIDAQIVGWLQTYTPRTVLLHIGTNDAIQNFDFANAPARLSALIDHIVATEPQVDLFVASIVPLADAASEARAETFNAAIPGIVAAKVRAGAHLTFVDMHAALSTSDLADGIHPNAAGYTKMGDRWLTALNSVPGSLTGTGGTPSPSGPASPSPSRSAAPSPSPSAPPSGARTCTATYRVVGQWPGGFQGEVAVTAGGSTISGWKVTWGYANGQTVTQFWSATVTTSGATVTATNVSYNGSLAAGAGTTFGFLGSAPSTNTNPTPTCTAQ